MAESDWRWDPWTMVLQDRDLFVACEFLDCERWRCKAVSRVTYRVVWVDVFDGPDLTVRRAVEERIAKDRAASVSAYQDTLDARRLG